MAAELPDIPPFERAWVESHLANPPRLATFSTSDDGSGAISLWLVTEHTGAQDDSTRVVFDAQGRRWGLAMDLMNDIEWFMGFYHGGFADVIDAM